MNYAIRAVREEGWEKVKEIRLASLKDPVAHIAFMDSYDEAAKEPDTHWQERSMRNAEGKTARQFIAETPDGHWLGTVTLIVELPGVESFDDIPEVPQTHIVGVFVRPEARGIGLAEQLCRAGVEWSWNLPDPRIERVHLWVHENNAGAEGLYNKLGFKRTGESGAFPGDRAFMEHQLAITRG